MSEPKFTPGLWQVMRAGVQIRPSGDGMLVTESVDITAFITKGGRIYDVIPSNITQLIAAAPDMYTMLAEISDSVGTLLLDNDGIYLRDEIDKLLARARGEA